MDKWIVGFLESCIKSRVEYTKRRTLNRGYMKLDVWQKGMDLFAFGFDLENKLLALISSLESGRAHGSWQSTLPTNR